MENQLLLNLMFHCPFPPPLLLPFSPFSPPLPSSRFASAVGIVFSYLPHPLNPPQFSPFLSLFIVSPLFPTRPPSQCLPLALSSPTPGSKVSCLTVNVLSFPQREATRRQRENYSVLHSVNLHCVTHILTHTHTLMVGLRALLWVCAWWNILPLHQRVCVDMRGHRASQQF